MTLKPPTRTFPKLVMKEWPEKTAELLQFERDFVMQQKPLDSEMQKVLQDNLWDLYLKDFTRVVEETGILDQERSQKEGSRDE